MAGHVLYQTGDADAPSYIKDRNGEVVLSLCKLCGKAEGELGDTCQANSFAELMVSNRVVLGPLPSTLETYREEAQDRRAVGAFAVAMTEKLARKAKQGRGGWKDEEQCSVEYIADLLIEHVHKGDPVDIGNLAMMLHQRKAPADTIPAAFSRFLVEREKRLTAETADMLKAIAFAIQEDDKYNAIAFLEAWSEGNHLEEWPEYADFVPEK